MRRDRRTTSSRNGALWTIGKDVLGYLPAQWIPAVASLLAVSVYTRFLDPDEFGFYVLTTSTVSMCIAVGFGWLSNATLRFYEKHRVDQRLDEFGSTALVLLFSVILLTGAGWAIAVRVIFGGHAPQLASVLRVGGWLLVARAIYSFSISVLRAKRDIRTYAILSSSTTVVGVALSILFLVVLRLGASGIVAATAVSFGLLSAVAFVRIARSWNPRLKLFRRRVAAEFAAYGVPLIGLSFGGMVLSFADRYMLQFLVGPAVVGIYGAGYALANRAVVMLSSVVAGASFPVLIRAYERDGETRTSSLLSQISGVYVGVMLPAVIGFSLLASDVVRLLGGQYRGSGSFLPWIAGGAFCLGLAQIAGKPFELRKRTKPLLLMIAGAALLNVILNLLLIPQIGAQGAAYATMISYLIHFIAVRSVGKRLLRWSFPYPTLWRVAVAAGVMAVVVVVLRVVPSTWGVVARVGAGAASYLAVLLLLREPLFCGLAMGILSRWRAAEPGGTTGGDSGI